MTANIPVLPLAGGDLGARLCRSGGASRPVGSSRRAGTQEPPRGAARWPASTTACWPISASTAPTCATPSPSRSGTTRPRCCASARIERRLNRPLLARSKRPRTVDRLPPAADRTVRRAGHLVDEIRKRPIPPIGRPIRYAAIIPSRGPDRSARRPLRRAHSFLVRCSALQTHCLAARALAYDAARRPIEAARMRCVSCLAL